MTEPAVPAEAEAMAMAEVQHMIQVYVQDYGIGVVHFTAMNYMAALLKFSASMMVEGELSSRARELGLNQKQTNDAIDLMGSLCKSESPHHAWLVAQLLKVYANRVGMDNIIAAFNTQESNVAPS